MISRVPARLGVLCAALTVAVALTTPAAYAQGGGGEGGLSTPGATVTAENAGASPFGSALRITLTAHTEHSTVADPSCRPPDLNLRCWGFLYLRVPRDDAGAGGMTVTNFEVHRVAVGDISCGDDHDGDCGDEGGDCGDEGGDCGDCGEGGMATTAAVPSQPVLAQVNGVALIANPGRSGLPTGTKVQVKITLYDNGTAAYADQVDVQINRFQPGCTKPLIYRTDAPQTVQQVGIHLEGESAG